MSKHRQIVRVRFSVAPDTAEQCERALLSALAEARRVAARDLPGLVELAHDVRPANGVPDGGYVLSVTFDVPAP